MPYQATSLNTVVQMVANGIGITLLPEMALQAHILRGTNVETRRFDEAGIDRGIGIAWRKHSPRQHEFKMLGELIQGEISE
jgi:LysR family hydrogen peroxide-inducible transcriptional activator